MHGHQAVGAPCGVCIVPCLFKCMVNPPLATFSLTTFLSRTTSSRTPRVAPVQITFSEPMASHADATLHVAPNTPPPGRQVGDPLQVYLDMGRAAGAAGGGRVEEGDVAVWWGRGADVQLSFARFSDAMPTGRQHGLQPLKFQDTLVYWHEDDCQDPTLLAPGTQVAVHIPTHSFGQCGNNFNNSNEDVLFNDTCPSTSVHCPSASVHCPSTSVHCPSTSVHCPSTSVHCPSTSVHCPSTSSHCPSTSVHCPSTSVHCPSTSVHCPSTSVHCPSTSEHCPSTSVHCPSTSDHCPSTSVHCPSTSVHCPSTSVLCPSTSVHCPSTSVHCPSTSVLCPSTSVHCPSTSEHCPSTSVHCPSTSEHCPSTSVHCPSTSEHCPSTSVHCPSTSEHCPSTSVHCPSTSEHCPSTSVHCPSTSVHCPSTSVHCPSTSVLCPSTSVHCPSTSVHCPSTSVLCPSTSVHCPSTSEHCPSTSVHCPSTSEHCPSTSVHCPSTSVHCPSTSVHCPSTSVHCPSTSVTAPPRQSLRSSHMGVGAPLPAWDLHAQKAHCLSSNYKFELVVDDPRLMGFVSWKLLRTLEAGTVPIYYGAPDVDNFMPPGSYIDGRKLPTPAELLAALQELHLDPLKYMDLFAWRTCGVWGHYAHVDALGFRSLPCRLCEAVSARHGRLFHRH
ncbi:unnamed protein product [Closterium sp. Naga37s-1]|nr:unnamed protein product [Closterium sp. Naga37s-1]